MTISSCSRPRAEWGAAIVPADRAQLGPKATRIRPPKNYREVGRWFDQVQKHLAPLGGDIYRAADTPSLRELLKLADPTATDQPDISFWRRANWRNLWRGLERTFLASAHRITHVRGIWYLGVLSEHGDMLTDYGLASADLMVDDGAEYVTDAYQNLEELELQRFHGIGVDATAPAVGQAALISELTGGQYTAGIRASGSQAENGAQVYRTIGDNQVAVGALSIVEAGIFPQSALLGGTMLDRGTFGAVNPAAGQIVRTTYDHTTNSGGT